VFRWLHIGDSHTAGDYLTGELRRRLQARYGDAGIGWITPGYVNGQRSDSVKLSNENGWDVSRAARQKLEPAAVPFGGQLGSNVAPPAPVVTTKKSKKKQKKKAAAPSPVLPAATTAAGLRLTFKHPEPAQPMRVSVLRSLANNSAVLEVASDVGSTVKLPALVAEGGPWQVSAEQVDVGGEHVWLRLGDAKSGAPATVAGVALEKPGPGVVLDAIGVNGAQIDEFLGWSEDALTAALSARPPNVVVLEFGTNESVGRHFDAAAYIEKVTTAVRRLRAHSTAAIVLMLPPDTRRAAKVGRRRRKPETCGAALEWLQAVSDALTQVAKNEKTLLWDWGQWVRGTGAVCGTFSLAHMTPSLARPDYVHLSPEGYQATAVSFLDDVYALVGVREP
jgi:lysophospholipase L1-like esterase